MTASTVTIGELLSEYRRRRVAWSRENDRIRVESTRLSQLHFPAMQLVELLTHSTPEERANLASILGLSTGSLPVVLDQAVRKAGSHTLVSLMRNADVAYDEVAGDVADKVCAAKVTKGQPIATIERATIEDLFNKRLSAATPDERRAILSELGKDGAFSSAAAATGGVVVAHLSGFALYTAASSTLAVITGAFGLTLPFAVYTGMSSVIATVIGPVGWVAMGLLVAVKAGGPNYKKTIPSVLAIATMRARLTAEHHAASMKLKDEVARNDFEGSKLGQLESFLRRYIGQSKSVSVAQSSVPR